MRKYKKREELLKSLKLASNLMPFACRKEKSWERDPWNRYFIHIAVSHMDDYIFIKLLVIYAVKILNLSSRASISYSNKKYQFLLLFKTLKPESVLRYSVLTIW